MNFWTYLIGDIVVCIGAWGIGYTMGKNRSKR